MGTEFQFGKVRKFWRWMVLMVFNSVNVLNATEQYILKCLSGTFMLCIFYHNKLKTTKVGWFQPNMGNYCTKQNHSQCCVLETELNKMRVQFLEEFTVAMENRLEKEYNTD